MCVCEILQEQLKILYHLLKKESYTKFISYNKTEKESDEKSAFTRCELCCRLMLTVLIWFKENNQNEIIIPKPCRFPQISIISYYGQ